VNYREANYGERGGEGDVVNAGLDVFKRREENKLRE
jgi:hypothetical protein